MHRSLCSTRLLRRLVVLATFIGFASLAVGFAPTPIVSSRCAGAAEQAAPADWIVDFECRWADSPVTVDGKDDEPVWKHAQTIEQFYLPWLRAKARPSRTATRARLLWDREYLYFFADMDDADLYADQPKDDEALWLNDVFELFFKPSDEQTSYYEFQVTPAGKKLDMFLPSRGAGGYQRFKSDVPFHWETKVALRGTLNKWQDKDGGWSVEGRLPWRDFLRTGGRPRVDDRWKFALCRYDYSVGFEQPELSTCAPMKSAGSPNFHAYEDYARLRFVGSKAESATRPLGVERLAPFTTSRVVGSPEPPPPYRARRVHPNLKLTFPVVVEREPGARRFWIVDQTRPYGPTRLVRTAEDPDSGAPLEELKRFSHLAYSLCFHPQFAKNGYLYVGHNDAIDGKRRSQITRYTIGRTPPFAFDEKSAAKILDWESDGHNGVAITFGLDGMMYVTSGDGTSDSDTNVVGQRLDLLTAKVLRIDVDRPDAGRAYSVPRDNPFVDVKDARPETWAYGLRNPWRITTDPKTGHIWVGNNGQDLWEQAYLLKRGANYGWSVFEGNHPFYATRTLGPTPHTPPTVEHSHAEARSLTGGVVYHGLRLPELRGAYIYGDHSTGKIWGARHDGQKLLWHKELTDTSMNITAFLIDHDGELLVVDHRGKDEGGLYTLEPTPPAAGPSTFPRTISASGLFEQAAGQVAGQLAGHRMAPGVVPYSVNSPLWSDGSHKERFLAIPADAGDAAVAGPYIDFHPTKAWKFPDRTVLVKSFALDMVEGDPSSRRWIETRFLTKQEGEWIGYTYRWNDSQTDAVLVEAAGADAEFSIRTADGMRKQAWRYPSRTECMVCHSRASGFVLGLSTPQMNRDHDYGGVKDNQLRVLEHLGLLRMNWQADVAGSIRQTMKDQKKTSSEIETYVRELTWGKAPQDYPSTSLLMQAPEKYARLADPYDESQPLDLRARSYLHANCSHCHVKAGGGNAQFEVEFATSRTETGLFDARPQHHTFGLVDARLVAPGSPERSVLLHRVAIRDRGQMPQLATTLSDRRAVDMLRRWILELEAPDAGAKPKQP